MVELKEMTPCAGLLPLTYGTVTAEEVTVGPMNSLSAFGDAAAVLKSAHDLAWPSPGKSTTQGDLRCIWFGAREVLLVGAAPDARLSEVAAVVDQSDGWAVVDLHGPRSVDVLARLVPVDLRDQAFAVGDTARTQIVHVQASISKIKSDRFRLMVFRSMAATLVHDLEQAMAAVAARG